jgi:hypothetical protein
MDLGKSGRSAFGTTHLLLEHELGILILSGPALLVSLLQLPDPLLLLGQLLLVVRFLLEQSLDGLRRNVERRWGRHDVLVVGSIQIF